ncbi:MAG: RNA polymerase sigma factor [Verrucomicrobiae bacterium]|nr:RNA polymerase sigma factor [Verrucomicrobiae bacterium]
MESNETDRGKFLALIEQHQGILHRVCAVYARREVDRQDLFQDMLLQVWRSYPSFRGESAPSTWMYRVALNTALLQQRSARRRPDLTHGGDDRIASSSVEPKCPGDASELLHACIRELPTLDRALILLHLEERSYEEIAGITGLTRTNVSVRLVRIKAKLRRTLEEKGLGKEALA